MIGLRHALSVTSAGDLLIGDSAVAGAELDAGGAYLVRLSRALPTSEYVSALLTRRGTDLRYVASVENTTPYVKRIVIRDTSLSIITSAFDLLLYAHGPDNDEIECVTWGAVTGSSGAEAIAAPNCAASRTTTGDYNLTLDSPGLAASACLGIHLTRVGQGTRCSPSADHTSDTVKRVTMRGAGGSLIDADFAFAVYGLAA